MDYNLLVRTDTEPEDGGEANAKDEPAVLDALTVIPARRARAGGAGGAGGSGGSGEEGTVYASYRVQMLQRLQAAQRSTYFLHCALQGQVGDAATHFEQLMRVAYPAPSTSAQEDELSRQQWSQRLCLGSNVDGVQRPTAVLQASTRALVGFCINGLGSAAHLTDSGARTSTTNGSSERSSQSLRFATNKDALDGMVAFLHAVRDLRDVLLDEKLRFMPTATTATNTAAAANTSNETLVPLSPMWLRTVSTFVRTVGTWVPLLLQACLAATPGHRTETSLPPPVPAAAADSGTAKTRSKAKQATPPPPPPSAAPTKATAIKAVIVDRVLSLPAEEQQQQQQQQQGGYSEADLISELGAAVQGTGVDALSGSALRKHVSAAAQLFVQLLGKIQEMHGCFCQYFLLLLYFPANPNCFIWLCVRI